MFKQTLLYGGVFKANNPQVIRIGLTALSSVQGMTQYVKVSSPTEILIGSSINVLQFILNDEYTLRKLGIDQTKILINILLTAGISLGVATAFPVVAASALYSGITLVIVSTAVAMFDSLTDVHEKLIESVIGEEKTNESNDK
ncbi:hypothetical protein [Vibrio ouci]|uniref:Uncharacterized protein n=1 Tax=Vibrio ouci TaxID=2499078 RepID=A0A4Y8WD79_9VIBR|nr:hypothetical protein [Vibrio ouci]TFH90882.1 hypothetical protein ELS82_14225 [Vibrio ouci]